MNRYVIVVDRKIPREKVLDDLYSLGISVKRIFRTLDNTFTVLASRTQLENIDGIISADLDDTKIDISSVHTWYKQSIVTKEPPIRKNYDFIYTGRGTTIYLVDTGVNTSISEFRSAQISNLHTTSRDWVDKVGHGTGLASLIVGKKLGISKKTHLKVVKFLDEAEQNLSISSILESFDAILEDHLKTPDNVKVVNCSWIMPKNKTIDLKVTELKDNNMVVVAASGNKATNVDSFSPGGLDTILTIGAHDKDYNVSGFTNLPNEFDPNREGNHGREIDLFAPGSNIPVIDTNNRIKYSNGTSIAAAIASAGILHFIEMNPGLNSDDIQSLVIDYSRKHWLKIDDYRFQNTANRYLFIPNARDMGEKYLPDIKEKIKDTKNWLKKFFW